jgi:hypothetical protein
VWLNGHHLERINVRKPALDFLNNSGSKDVSSYASKAISWAEGAAVSFVSLLFSTVLIIVVSIYMLLDMQRPGARHRSAVPAATGVTPADVARRARARRVRQGTTAPLGDHRHERRASDCGCSGSRGCFREATSTRSSSGSSSRSPS